MIAYITGKLTHKEPTYVIVDIGGLGYSIRISLHTFSQIKDLDRCQLFTHLQITENAHTLYGFATLAEKDWFLSLGSISGVGSRTAITALSSLSPHELQQAVIHEDVPLVQSIKGVGNKTAQRIILELKDKIGKVTLQDTPLLAHKNSHEKLRQEALKALTTLGISKNIAEKSISTILCQHTHKMSLEELIKLALKDT